MSNFSLINHLVRLAQIAEEIEESNPAAADLIDTTISDQADGLPDSDFDPAMFPKINTPGAEGVSDDLVQQITDSVMASPDFAAIAPNIGENTDALGALVQEEIQKVLSR